MSMLGYADYKESGITWLGVVPAHWPGPKPIGAVSSLKGRLGWQGLKADEYQSEGPYVVSSAHFSEHQVRWNDCPRVSLERYDIDANIQLAEGDVLLMKDGAAMGKLAYVERLPGPACINSHLLLFRPLENSGKKAYMPKFAFYFFQTSLFQEHIKTSGTGATFLGISQDAISRYPVVWPPLAEQEAICKFLDRETAKIDALIAEQEKLLALLAEKRQATISHAVTRGLNPSTPMKDSGIPWLGEVPAHWKIMALGRITISKCDGPFGSGLKSDHYVDEGARVIRLQNIRGGRFDDRDAAFIELGYFESEMARHAVREGDLLIAGLGDDNNIVGRACVAPRNIYPALVKADCFRFRLNPDQAVPEFVAWALTAGATHDAGTLSSGSTRSRIPLSVMASRKIPLPPISEQLEIADRVEVLQSDFDRLVATAKEAIELLRERRSALISAAVTGKVDVRHAA